MKISEFTGRARRLKRLVPDLKIGFNEDEGLTLVATIDGKRLVLVGETNIIVEMEMHVLECVKGLVTSIESESR